MSIVSYETEKGILDISLDPSSKIICERIRSFVWCLHDEYAYLLDKSMDIQREVGAVGRECRDIIFDDEHNVIVFFLTENEGLYVFYSDSLKGRVFSIGDLNDQQKHLWVRDVNHQCDTMAECELGTRDIKIA